MKRFYGYTALALVMATPGWALSPQEAWEHMQQYYQRAGIELSSGGENVEGNALIVSNVTFEQEQPSASFSVDFGDLRFEPVEGDAVRLTMAETASAEISFDTPDGPQSLPMTFSMPGNATVISGTTGDLTYETVMPQFEMAGTMTMVDDGRTVEIPVALRGTGVEVTDHITGTTDLTSSQQFAAQRIEVAISGRDTGAADPANLTGRDRETAKHGGGHGGEDRLESLEFLFGVDGVSGNARSVLPEAATVAVNEGDMSAAVRAGFDVSGTLNFTGMAMNGAMSGTDEDGQVQNGSFEMTGGAGSLAGGMNSQQLTYQTSLDSASFRVTSNELDAPISFSTGAQTLDVQMPLLAGDQAQPFKVANSAADIVLSDEIWAMFDPESALSRDPASFDLDVTGNVMLTRDLMDRETEELMARLNDPELTAEQRDEILRQLMRMGGPGELRDLNINQFALSLLGANVTANGELAVPEGGSIDSPVGSLSARYEGVNALLETLVSAGLVPQDQVMGIRMGLMMFARAEGEDTMVTDLEFREDGSIFANGQQVR